jgi:magnesium-transporting ATPase (P-type)
MIALSICHSIIVEKNSKKEINYLSSSPDEMALINCARYFKYIFKGKDIDNKITISILGKDVEFHLLHILEYSSER